MKVMYKKLNQEKVEPIFDAKEWKIEEGVVILIHFDDTIQIIPLAIIDEIWFGENQSWTELDDSSDNKTGEHDE